MAYFPDKTAVKTELRETTHKADLSCVHLTTADFFELNVAYYRENTPREHWKSNQGVFARPVPMQAPVMGEATLKLRNYYVPYRILSPQWEDFITRTPHTPYNGSTPIIVSEMPYTMSTELVKLVIRNGTIVQNQGDADFISDGGVYYKLTKGGRHIVKILNQLGYQIVMDEKCTEHFDMMPLLAFAKIYLDYYTSNQYSNVIQAAYKVEALLKKDNTTPYMLTVDDLMDIFNLTHAVNYAADYFVSQWDTPTAPTDVATSMGNISLQDITAIDNHGTLQGNDVVSVSGLSNTAAINPTGGAIVNPITQYQIDALKGLTDYVKRMQLSVRAIDRYLERFGVMLTSQKMNRAQYNGEQNTTMNFGAVYSTAETNQAAVGDYAGQGVINSNGQNHNTFEYQGLDEFGCIMSLFTIDPKIGYYQGIDRQHLLRDPESYFNGQWDAIGTQATSAAELYISNNGQSIYGKQAQFDTIFGYLPRNAHAKVGKDRLTGDFVRTSINAGADAWHLFRRIDETRYNQSINNMVHSPEFINTVGDMEQYNRIFNYTGTDDADNFNVIILFNIEANIHGKPLYDSYDFEGEGKKIIMDGQGPKHN